MASCPQWLEQSGKLDPLDRSHLPLPVVRKHGQIPCLYWCMQTLCNGKTTVLVLRSLSQGVMVNLNCQLDLESFERWPLGMPTGGCLDMSIVGGTIPLAGILGWVKGAENKLSTCFLIMDALWLAVLHFGAVTALQGLAIILNCESVQYFISTGKTMKILGKPLIQSVVPWWVLGNGDKAGARVLCVHSFLYGQPQCSLWELQWVSSCGIWE